MPANLQGAPVPARKTSSMVREWRLASRTVRFSAICLAIFYLLAAASPFFASYDPTYQNREMPDCPPMSIHLSAPSEWSRSLFYTHPMHMQDAKARKYVADERRRGGEQIEEGEADGGEAHRSRGEAPFARDARSRSRGDCCDLQIRLHRRDCVHLIRPPPMKNRRADRPRPARCRRAGCRPAAARCRPAPTP